MIAITNSHKILGSPFLFRRCLRFPIRVTIITQVNVAIRIEPILIW